MINSSRKESSLAQLAEPSVQKITFSIENCPVKSPFLGVIPIYNRYTHRNDSKCFTGVKSVTAFLSNVRQQLLFNHITLADQQKLLILGSISILQQGNFIKSIEVTTKNNTDSVSICNRYVGPSVKAKIHVMLQSNFKLENQPIIEKSIKHIFRTLKDYYDGSDIETGSSYKHKPCIRIKQTPSKNLKI